MAERWYISDTHFGHYNIINYCKRPFQNTKEMDEYMKTMWNETVKPQDHITHLGDVTMDRGGRVAREQFIKFIRSLNGHKRLLLGNHDHFPTKVYLDAGFEKIYGTWRTEERLLFSHIPIHPASLGTSRANVHGHIHSNPDYEPVVMDDRIVPYINCSVEVIHYKPIHLDELFRRVNEVNNT